MVDSNSAAAECAAVSAAAAATACRDVGWLLTHVGAPAPAAAKAVRWGCIRDLSC